VNWLRWRKESTELITCRLRKSFPLLLIGVDAYLMRSLLWIPISRVTASYPEEKRAVHTRQKEVQELWEQVKVKIRNTNV
jgi:hypothetical protein